MTEQTGRERDYRLVQAATKLLSGPDSERGDVNVLVIAGADIRDFEQTEALLHILAAQNKGCLYIQPPAVWTGSRPPYVHIILRTGRTDPKFDLILGCSFWAADDTSPFLIVSPGGARGWFEMTRGGLVHHEGSQPGARGPGISRANRRLLAEIQQLRKVDPSLSMICTRVVRDTDDLREPLGK